MIAQAAPDFSIKILIKPCLFHLFRPAFLAFFLPLAVSLSQRSHSIATYNISFFAITFPHTLLDKGLLDCFALTLRTAKKIGNASLQICEISLSCHLINYL